MKNATKKSLPDIGKELLSIMESYLFPKIGK